MLPIFNSEDDDGAPCVRVPARGLPPPVSGAALASLQGPFSAFFLTRRNHPRIAQRAEESGEDGLSCGLKKLSSC
jgi:hypothetical protein